MRLKNTGSGKEISLIERFLTVEQIAEVAEYYIKLLGLQDWMIRYELTDELGEGNGGENEYQFVNKYAVIRIRKTLPESMLFRQPQELTLIHELLHCKFMLLDNTNYDGIIIYEYQHQLLQDMARAIFNARYNLTNKFYMSWEETK